MQIGQLNTSQKRLNLNSINNVETILVLLRYKKYTICMEKHTNCESTSHSNVADKGNNSCTYQTIFKTYETGQTLNNGMKPLTYGRIYIYLE